MNLPNARAVELEILYNGLLSVADESFTTLTRSAMSTNIKERRDHSIAVTDAVGRLVAQATQSLPIHLSSMAGLMEHLLAKVAVEDMRPGDIYIANDPHVAGGTHLPDVNMAMPVFHGGRVIAFVCNIAHHADIGGMAAGSMSSGMREIFQEGVRIPVVKLFDAGVLQEDLLDLLLLNMRLPHERRGDINAQVGACRLGATRLLEIVERMGLDLVLDGFDEILVRTERRMRDALSAIPDGTYNFEDVLDDDGIATRDVLIKLEISKSGDRISFDFAGSAPQVEGNMNMTLNATQCAVCYAIKALLDPEIPNNQGIIDVMEVSAPEGTVTNCLFPAAVALRANSSQRVVDVVLGALADALPEQTIGAANGSNTSAVFWGRNSRTGGDYVYLETLGGGMGGRNDRDGKDGVQVHITNTSNLPIEAIEMEYPLRVEAYGFVPDSGGAGRHRGGLGLRRVIRPLGHECNFSGAGERFSHQPWGIFEGEAGSSGRFTLIDADGRESELAGKPSDVRFDQTQAVVVETPGAGGYGNPSERAAGDIERDRESGKFSAAYLAKYYSGGE